MADPNESEDDITPREEPTGPGAHRDAAPERDSSGEPSPARAPREAPGREDWADESYPAVNADFVGATLDRVLSDRDEIEFEAGCVDDVHFEDGFLDAYAAPDPHPGFVEATVRRVLAERRAGRVVRSDADFELARLLDSCVVPDPSPDFVDRTLAAVLAQHAARGPLPRARPRSAYRARRFSIVASLAALLLCAVAILWSRIGNPAPAIPPSPGSGVPVTAAPVAWASLVVETDTDRARASFVTIRNADPIADLPEMPR